MVEEGWGLTSMPSRDQVIPSAAVDAGTPDEATGDGRRPSGEGADRLTERLCGAALAVTLVPLAVAAVRAVARGWVPVGDAATIGIRARDVLGGGELPLLGPSTTSSWTSGIYQNHPGPLFYDALAVPAALFRGPAGLVVGTVLIEAVAILGIFVLARRLGGPSFGLLALAMTAVLCWSMGSAVLVEPWPPNTLLLPVVCLVLLAWSVAVGDVACLPWLAGVASFVIQTNMSYGVLVPLLVAYACVELVRRRGGLASFRRTAWVTAAVVAVLWIQPLVEQVAGRGEGNLSRIVRGLGEGPMTLNWRTSVQSVADVVALPPWWARPSFADSFRFGLAANPLPPLGLALLALALVAGLLVWCRRQALRDGDDVSAAGLTTAAVLLVASVVTANQTPTTGQGTVAYQLRWLWPVALGVWLAVAGFGLRRVARRPAARRVPVLLFGVTVVVSLLNLPWTNQGSTAPEPTAAVARDVVRAIERAELEGSLLVETDEGIWDPYSEAVLFALQDEGVDVVVHDRIGYRMLGDSRRWDGHNADALVRVSGSDWAMVDRPGARVIARHPGLDREDHDEMHVLRQDIEQGFADGDLALNHRGRDLAEQGGFDSVPTADPDRVDPDTVTATRFWPFGRHRRDVLLMIREDLLDAPGWTDRLERFADLQETWDTRTVAVFLEPIAAADLTAEPERPPAKLCC
jgi:hypothetical protein